MTPRKPRPATVTTPPPGEEGFSPISNQKLVALYAAMLKFRMLERRVRAQAAETNPRLRGREAVAAGIAINLLPEDQVRAADGSPLPEFVQQLVQPGSVAEDAVRNVLGRLGVRDRRERSRASRDEAMASARGLKDATGKNAVALFMGLARAPKDVLGVAAAEKLPILFICQSRDESENLAAMADGCGLPGMVVDCEDAVAVYRVAAEALAHARRGNGPTLIECRRWPIARIGEERNRSGGDAARAMERYLAGKNLWTRELKKETQAEFARVLDIAFASTRSSAS
jgi:acetoin:2,6-dichlorophenolindophenol oxidoreductase subunit alpha